MTADPFHGARAGAVALLGALLVAGVGAGAEIAGASRARADAAVSAVAAAADGTGPAFRVIAPGGLNPFGIATGRTYSTHPDPARVGLPPAKADGDLATRVLADAAPRAVEGPEGITAAVPLPGGAVALATLPPPPAGARFHWGLAALLWLLASASARSLRGREWFGLLALTAALSALAPPLPAVGAGLAGLALLGPAATVVAAFRRDPTPYLYAAPALAALAVLVMVPFTVGVGLSFFEHRDGAWSFVGLSHFAEILSPAVAGPGGGDVRFWRTLAVTVLWTASNVTLHLLIGLSLALLLKDGAGRLTPVYRVLLVLPWAVPNYITALTWKGMFAKDFGAINALLVLCGGERVDWLGSTFLPAFSANLATNTWLGFPFMMVVSLGALQSIPAELYEAARVDGAGAWARFRHITLPLLKPALFPAVILGSIWTFNMFNVIYLVSGGAPAGATDILVTEAYRAFRVLGRHGYAAAYSTVIFLILLGYTLATNRVTRATEGAFD